MENANDHLTPRQLESRRKNARKSTGPRTAAGKRRSAMNGLKYGYYTGPNTMEQSMLLLGEDPNEFHVFRLELIASRQPADAVEQMLVEDIAMLAWKKRRINRAQQGLQLRNLEMLELARHRQALEVGRETADISQDEVLKSGLRRAAPSPARFGEILSNLEVLKAFVARQDFSQDISAVITMLYGETATLRGAQIAHSFCELGEQGVESEEQRSLATSLKIAIEEEIRDVMEEYTLFLQEHVHISPALRDSALAPVHPEWTAIVRHEYTLDRLIERKLKLLMQIQRARKIQERVAEEAEQRAEKQKRIPFLKNEPERLLKTKDRGQKANRTEPKNEAEKLLKTRSCGKKEPKPNRRTNRARLSKTQEDKNQEPAEDSQGTGVGPFAVWASPEGAAEFSPRKPWDNEPPPQVSSPRPLAGEGNPAKRGE